MEENVEKIDKKFEAGKKNKKGVLACILIVLILALVAGGIFTYYKISSKPKAILKKFVNKLVVENTEKTPETIKESFKFAFKLDTDNKETKLLFNELSKCSFKTDIQVDFKNQKEIIGAGLAYDSEDVLGGKIIYDDETLYAYLEGIYEKYIKINTNDEMKETISKAFETATKGNNTDETKEVIELLKSILIEKIENSQEITQETVTISVKDKDKKVLKTSIKLYTKDLTNLLSDFCTKLSESKIYENNEKDKKDLKDVAKEIKETPTNSDDYVLIDLYTEGLNNKFSGIAISIFVKESDMNLKFEAVKEDKSTFKYIVSGNGQGAYITIATGEIRINKEVSKKEQEKGSFAITAEIPEVITKAEKINIEVKVDYDVAINTPIDTIDTSNSIDMDKISDEDYELMLEKLEQNPIIGPAITLLMDSFTQTYDYNDFYFDDYTF